MEKVKCISVGAKLFFVHIIIHHHYITLRTPFLHPSEAGSVSQDAGTYQRPSLTNENARRVLLRLQPQPAVPGFLGVARSGSSAAPAAQPKPEDPLCTRPTLQHRGIATCHGRSARERTSSRSAVEVPCRHPSSECLSSRAPAGPKPPRSLEDFEKSALCLQRLLRLRLAFSQLPWGPDGSTQTGWQRRGMAFSGATLPGSTGSRNGSENFCTVLYILHHYHDYCYETV